MIPRDLRFVMALGRVGTEKVPAPCIVTKEENLVARGEAHLSKQISEYRIF